MDALELWVDGPCRMKRLYPEMRRGRQGLVGLMIRDCWFLQSWPFAVICGMREATVPQKLHPEKLLSCRKGNRPGGAELGSQLFLAPFCCISSALRVAVFDFAERSHMARE